MGNYLGSLELNRIYQMNCLEGMKLIPAGSIDMILCDLPYGTTRNKWDSVIPLEPLWEQYKRIIKDDGAIILTAQTPFDKVLGSSNLEWLRYEWIWEKDRATGHLNAKKMPMKAHENILVFYKKLPTYNPQKTTGHRPMNTSYGGKRGNNNYGEYVNLDCGGNTDRYPRSVQKINSVNTNGKEYCGHGTQKPVELFRYLIRTYSNPNDIILDNCMGSGTTAVSCETCEDGRRNWIGFEIESMFIEIANKRLDGVYAAEDDEKLQQ